MFKAEGVEKAGGEQVGDSLALFVGKAGVMMILFRPGEIDFFMGGVKVAAGDNGLCFF